MSLDPAVPANDASAGRDLRGRLRWVAALLALASITTGTAALVGYLRHEPMLVQVRPGLQGMSPVTALGLLAAASAVLSQAMRARRIASLAGGQAAQPSGAAMLLIHALTGQDSVSAWLAGALFSAPAATVGRNIRGHRLPLGARRVEPAQPESWRAGGDARPGGLRRRASRLRLRRAGPLPPCLCFAPWH